MTNIRLVMLVFMLSALTLSEEFVVTIKNDKLESIRYQKKLLSQSIDQYNYIWIRNTKQAFTICSSKDHYLIPNNLSFKDQNCTGFKYFNKTGQSQLKEYLNKFLISIEYDWTTIRLEDSFYLEAYIHNVTQKAQICRFSAKYLHTTLDVEKIPTSMISVMTIRDIKEDFIHVSPPNAKAYKIQKQQQIVLQRTVNGSGLHQSYNISLIIPSLFDVTPQCSFIFSQILPQTIYIDQDQLPKVQRYETINVENPAHLSKQYYYQYAIPFKYFNQTGIHKYTHMQPMHFRYPQPSTQQFQKVYIPPIEKAILKCPQKTYTITQDLDFQRGFKKIPAGNINHKNFVSMITFISTLLAALLLSRMLRK